MKDLLCALDPASKAPSIASFSWIRRLNELLRLP